MEYGYEIYLDDNIVGDEGEITFETEEEALKDAKSYIENGLCLEYNVSSDKFDIKIYRYDK